MPATERNDRAIPVFMFEYFNFECQIRGKEGENYDALRCTVVMSVMIGSVFGVCVSLCE